MSWKTIALILVSLDFVALTGYAVATEGYLAFLPLLTSSVWGLQVGADLVIALAFVAVWMWRDARARGTSATPFLVVTLFLGSFGPLAYLVLRELRETRASHAPAAA